MAREVLTAKLDLVFKKFFVDNQDMLHPFVSSMIGIPEESITDRPYSTRKFLPIRSRENSAYLIWS